MSDNFNFDPDVEKIAAIRDFLAKPKRALKDAQMAAWNSDEVPSYQEIEKLVTLAASAKIAKNLLAELDRIESRTRSPYGQRNGFSFYVNDASSHHATGDEWNPVRNVYKAYTQAERKFLVETREFLYSLNRNSMFA